MKKHIHPPYSPLTVVCSHCGNTLKMAATLTQDVLHTERCLNCIPFRQASLNTGSKGGPSSRFSEKYKGIYLAAAQSGSTK